MRAVLYARVSSSAQDVDLSISAQLKALRDYASKNQYSVVKEFIDEAESGKTVARPAFREMIALARRTPKPFDLILVWKYSRFARNRQDSIVFKTMLRKKGIKVISINEPFEDNPTGKLMEAMIESLDEFYSLNLGEEITRGQRESASRGFYLASSTPFGYRKVRVRDGNKERPKLEPDPNSYATVESIFRSVIEGKGLKEIIKELNSKGIAGPKGKGWLKSTLHKILTNQIYVGTLVWGSHTSRDLQPIRVENAYPAIVDRNTFDQVQALMRGRAPANFHPKRVASSYLLSGIARCGHCGKALVGQDAKSGQFGYYVCGSLLKKGAGSCPSRYLNRQHFENLIIDKIKQHILTKENVTELIGLVNEEMDTASTVQRDQLNIVINEINDVSRRLDKLYDAVETGQIQLGDLAPRIQQLRQRQEQLQTARLGFEQQLSDRRVEPADFKTIMDYVGDLHDLLTNSPLSEKKALIRSFIKEVNVKDNQAFLTYTIPFPETGDSEEIEVLSTVHYGGAGGTRTLDLLRAREALSQLSYSPTYIQRGRIEIRRPA